MRDRSRAMTLARIGAFVAIATANFGGLMSAEIGSYLPAPKPVARQTPTVPLAPRTVVAWSIECVQGFRSAEIMHGEGFVGPDGALELGPYGSVRVAGLMPEPAQTALERHLARYLKNPRVRMTVMWDASQPAAPRAIASAGGQAIATASSAPPGGAWQPVPRPGAGPVGLGSPPPLADAITTGGEWRPVPRPGHLPAQPAPTQNVVQTTWHAPNRSSTEGAFAVADANVATRMPEGPVVQSEPKSGLPAKGDSLQIPPRKVPPGPPVVSPEGLPPAVCDAGLGLGGPAPTECKKVALPSYVIEPPDILVVASTLELRDQPVQGPHLVRPDGTISLGIYGSAYVAGMTLEMARDSIIAVLSQRIKNVDRRNVYVDVMAYNSKFYYVITDGAGYGETVIRFPITGSETVLDAISQIYGIPPVGNKKKIWVARSFPCGGHPQTLPVDWCAIAKGGDVSTNYQIMPGDRIYVQSQGIIRADSMIAKVVSPFERLFGVTLLGSSAINSIKFGASGFGGTGGAVR